MEVLAIGNSFSQDATRYLHRIARAAGEKLNVTGFDELQAYIFSELSGSSTEGDLNE